jgi:hypothetical protein
MRPNAGGGRGGGAGYSCAHGAQINFGDITPYLNYVVYLRIYIIGASHDAQIQFFLTAFTDVHVGPGRGRNSAKVQK